MAPRPPPTWTAEIALRVRRLLVLKLAGTSAFTWAFFIGYFHLLRHPAHPVTLMPLIALDRLIAFQPQALAAYVSLWLYIGVAPGLLLGFWELVVYGLWIGAMCLAGLACFYLWPTEVPPLALDVSGLPGFTLLQGVDASGNACPSMHVAAAVFSALWIAHLLREAHVPAVIRALNTGWFAAIVYSTLAVKQHVALDAIAGLLLGLAFALPSLRWRPAGRHRAAASVRANIIGHRR